MLSSELFYAVFSPYVHFVSLSSPLQDGPLAEALGAWKAEPKTTYQALQQPISAENEEKVKQQAMEIHGDPWRWCQRCNRQSTLDSLDYTNVSELVN